MSDLLITDEAVWRELVVTEMRLRGYTDEQIEAADKQRCDLDVCEFDTNHMAWDCTDENGKSHHPIADEYADIVGVIGRALEALEALESPQRQLAQTATRLGYELGCRDTAEAIAQALETYACDIGSWNADHLASVAREFATRRSEPSEPLDHSRVPEGSGAPLEPPVRPSRAWSDGTPVDPAELAAQVDSSEERS